MRLRKLLSACLAVVAVGLGAAGCDEGEIVQPGPSSAPPTVSVALSANPPSGVPPLVVSLSVSVGGTATGPITYKFDCSGDGDFEVEITTEDNPFTAVDACTYGESGTYTAKVVVEPRGASAEASTTVTVGPAAPPSQDSVVVSMKDDFFSSREVTVKPGTKIIWRNLGDRQHTSTSDDGVWDSGTLNPGESWSWTVPADAQSGTSLAYYCVFHGDPGGQGMAGVVHVQTDAPPPPPPNSVSVTTPGLTFSPERVEIRVGWTVIWEFSGTTHNVTFEDKAPPGGNIPDSPPGTVHSRTFPVAGDYDYECTMHDGMKGRVRVQSG